MNDYNLYLGQMHMGSCMKFEDETQARLKDKKCLEYYGFKVYSQNDEDGIIEEIFNRIGTTNKIFIEWRRNMFFFSKKFTPWREACLSGLDFRPPGG